MGHLCISDSVPSSVDQSLHLFPTASNASLLSQLISPSERGFPFQRGGFPYFGISPLLQLPCLRVQVLSRFLSSSFSLLFFILPSYAGVFIVLSGVQGLLLVFSQWSVRIVASIDVFLMHLWREVNSMSSYSSAIFLKFFSTIKLLFKVSSFTEL